MKAVFASHSAFDPVLRVGSHHLSREFARAGWETAHVSTPISIAHLLRAREPAVRRRFTQAARGRRDSDGVLRVVPLTVSPITRLPLSAGAAQISTGMRRWARLLHRPDFLIIDQPLLVGLVDLLAPTHVVYRPTDAHYDPLVREAELQTISRSSALVATSGRVLDEVRNGTDQDLPTLILENGVEFDRFAASASVTRTGLCYIGAVDHRFDWEMVTQIAIAASSTTVDIYGPISSRPPHDIPSNVRLMAALPYEQVPDILHAYRVGLMPFNIEPGNAGRSPMKFYEYLAAGLNILATPTPALVVRDAPGTWYLEGDIQSQTIAALSAPTNLPGVAHAKDFGWDARANELRGFLESLL